MSLEAVAHGPGSPAATSSAGRVMFKPPPPLVDSRDEDIHFPRPASFTEVRQLSPAEQLSAAIRGPEGDLRRVCLIVRGTIPDERLRPLAWQAMLGYLPCDERQWGAITAKRREEYTAFCEAIMPSMPDVRGNPQLDNTRIDVDVPRTLPTMHFFRVGSAAGADEACSEEEKQGRQPFSPNQLVLRRALHMFAHLNPGLGYVQGMNEVMGLLLFTFAEGKSEHVSLVEADVFFCFQSLMRYIGDNFCRELDFDAGQGVSSLLRRFDSLLALVDPEVQQALVAVELNSEFFAFRWLTLMFSQEFSLPDVMFLWDFFFSYESRITDVLLYFGVAMMTHVRDRLLEATFGNALQMLQAYPQEIEVNALRHTALDLIEVHGLDAARGRPLASAASTGAHGGDDDDEEPSTIKEKALETAAALKLSMTSKMDAAAGAASKLLALVPSFWNRGTGQPPPAGTT